MRLYHGTTATNARKILEFGKFNSNLQSIDSILYNGRRGRTKIPGSLGYGVYTFLDDPLLAKRFISKFSNDIMVIRVDVDVKNKDSILDFTNFNHQKQFRKFSENTHNVEKASNIFKAIPNKSNSKKDLFAGIMTELFIVFLRKKGVYIRFVKKQTETFLPPLDSSYQRLGIPNGTEFTIRYPEDIRAVTEYIFKEES